MPGFVNGTYTLEATTPFCSMSADVTVSNADTELDFLFQVQPSNYEVTQVTNNWVGAQDGELVISDCDDCSTFIALETPIMYFGHEVNQVYVNSNGFIMLGNSYSDTSSWLPVTVPGFETRGQIAPLWVDLDFRSQPGFGVWFKELTAGGFVVEWSGPDYDYLYWTNFSVGFSKDGLIRTHYKNVTPDPYYEVQLQGWDETQFAISDFPQSNSTYEWVAVEKECGFFPVSTHYLPIITK